MIFMGFGRDFIVMAGVMALAGVVPESAELKGEKKMYRTSVAVSIWRELPTDANQHFGFRNPYWQICCQSRLGFQTGVSLDCNAFRVAINRLSTELATEL